MSPRSQQEIQSSEKRLEQRPKTERAKSVADYFTECGLEIAWEESGAKARWKKLVWNIPFNGICALENLDTQEVLKQPHLRERILGLMREVCLGAAAYGFPLPLDFAEKMISATETMAAYHPSMAWDAMDHRPLEWQAIHGDTLNAMNEVGIAAPLLTALTERLKLFK
jgi:2-dehydropantoate 2-reductase